MENSVYHTGELKAQEKAGEKTKGERNGRVVTNKIISGAINFIENQPLFIASSKHESGEIWTSVLAGGAGYVKVKDSGTIEMYPHLFYSNPDDVFWHNIKQHSQVGLLFIEPATRRRFRVNGKVMVENGKLIILVDQAYPNCPKYIQQRHVRRTGTPKYFTKSIEGSILDPEMISMIKVADTFFVGSSNLTGDLDASHRGGLPGFIHVKDASTLIIPDYAGNSMFNTLGNFMVYPNAGLLFLDLKNKKSFQLTGTAEIAWNEQKTAINTGGTNRFWTFSIQKWILLENIKGFEWNFIGYSPFNPS